MQTPLVEMDGDEMTRILWQIIKDELLTPYLELNTEYYDLGLEHRNETDDQVTIDAAEATKKYGVAVKCATITPNAARMEEYDLKKMYKSPNGTIRAILDGTVFRAPIVVKGIEPCVKNWVKPITLARHAYGDIYKNTEFYIDKPGDAYLVFEGEDGEERKELIQHFDGAGVLRGMHNLDDSVKSFARSCFNYALDTKQDVWFGSKDTISKTYDGRFKEIFQQIFDAEFKDKFEEAGIPVDRIAGIPAFIAAGALAGIHIVKQEEQINVIPGTASFDELSAKIENGMIIVIMKLPGCQEAIHTCIRQYADKAVFHYFENVGTGKEYYTTDITIIHSKDFPYFSLLIVQPR